MELILSIAAFTFIYWVYPLIVQVSRDIIFNHRTQHVRYCCMVRPWHVHLVGNIKYIDEGFITKGLSGVIFSVTDRNLSEEELGKTLAHENRHIRHSLFGGIIYSMLCSSSKRFHDWAERDCERAESNPLRCKSL